MSEGHSSYLNKERLQIRKDVCKMDNLEKVEKIIGIPESQRAFGIFALGYPAEERTQQDRYDETRIHRVTRG